MFGGIISEMKVIRTENAARKYFNEVLNECGGIANIDDESFEDGSIGYYYLWDGNDNELKIEEVETEG